MNVRPALFAAAALATLAFAAVPARADSPKELENVKGSVSYQKPDKLAKPVAVNAVVALADSDYTITGAESLAQLTLPDSSQVMVGADTKVQLAFFDQTDIANAKFVVYQGRTRFAVRHPQGAKANYTFQTPTGTVAVRGTQGDIEYDRDGTLRVNVYEVCDPNLPVQVTTRGGAVLTLAPGQSLLARVVNGVVQTEVEQLTQQLIDRFSPEFGVPTSWDAAKGEVISYAQSKAAGAAENAVPGYGGAAVSAVGGLFSHKSKPAPTAKPATCQ
ncbi:MAG TPA: FecR family protein [Verrucomicrobiae bacterium]|nr:FecR family protein [Verrucomicrobiae bacterium]